MSVFQQLEQKSKTTTNNTPASSGGVFARLNQEREQKINEMTLDYFQQTRQRHAQEKQKIEDKKAQQKQQMDTAVQNFIDNLPMNRIQNMQQPQPQVQPEPPKLLTQQLSEMVDLDKYKDPNRPRTIEEELAYRAAERDKILPDNAFGDFLRNVYGGIDRFFLQNPIGSFLTRIGQSGAAALGQQPFHEAPSTGSKIVDTVADIGGTVGSVFVNPGGVTSSVAGQASIVGQIYNNPATQRLAQAAASSASNPTAQRVIQEATREAITGAVEGGAMALARTGDEQTALVEGAMGGVLGGAIGGAVPIVSQSVRNAIAQLPAPRERGNPTQSSVRRTETPSETIFVRENINTPTETPNAQSARVVVENMIEQAKVDPNNPLVRDNNVSGIGIVPFAPKPRLYDNVKTDTKSQLMTKIRKPTTTLNDKINQSYINMVDDLFSFQNFDKNVEKILGQKLKASESTYIPAITSRGSDIIAKQILTENMVDSQGNVIGKSLKEILRKLPKGKQVDFEDYLINKHAITRHMRGEKVFRDDLNWTPEFGARKVAEYEKKYPEFKQMADEYYKFRYDLAKSWLVDTGLISEDVLNKWIAENPFYVPMQRYFNELEKRGGKGLRAKSGFGDQSAPVRGYSKKGSQRLIISPIETTIENVDAYVKASKRNQVMQNLVNIIERDPEAFAGWAEIVPEQSVARQTSIKKINEIIENEGLDALIDQLNNDYEVLFSKSLKKDIDKDNVVRVMMYGQPVYVRINDPQLLDAISGLTPQAQGIMMRAISNTTRVVKLLTTGANPVFSVTRNMFRDIPMAFIASKTTNNPIRFAYDLIEGFVSALTNGRLYQSYKNIGGGHASAVAADRNLLAQSKREIIGNRIPRDYVGFLIGKIENFNNALEAAPRLGEFKRMIQQADNYENRLKGLFEANDITVNFKRRGKVSPQLDPFILYWNASVQGLDKAVRIFKDNPVAAGIKAFASITVPTIVLYALNHDKQEYQETSEYLKDNYYLIPTGDEKNPFVRIPKPQVLGVPFSTLPERMLRMWKDEDPDAFREFATTVVNQFLPTGVSGIVQDTVIEGKLPDPTADTIFGPFSDIRSNRNFAGAAIVPGYLEGVSPRLQYDSRTSELAKWIGDKLNWSPKQIDHLIKSYTGVLGQLGIPAMSEGATVGDTLLRQVTVDPVYSNNLMSKFYETKDRLDTMYKDIQQTGVIPPEYNDNLRKFMNRVSDAMSDVRKQMRAVEQDDSLTREQKKETNRELQKMLNNLAREANRIAEQAVR